MDWIFIVIFAISVAALVITGVHAINLFSIINYFSGRAVEIIYNIVIIVLILVFIIAAILIIIEIIKRFGIGR